MGCLCKLLPVKHLIRLKRRQRKWAVAINLFHAWGRHTMLTNGHVIRAARAACPKCAKAIQNVVIRSTPLFHIFTLWFKRSGLGIFIVAMVTAHKEKLLSSHENVNVVIRFSVPRWRFVSSEHNLSLLLASARLSFPSQSLDGVIMAHVQYNQTSRHFKVPL